MRTFFVFVIIVTMGMWPLLEMSMEPPMRASTASTPVPKVTGSASMPYFLSNWPSR